jgi:hypothetical protein
MLYLICLTVLSEQHELYETSHYAMENKRFGIGWTAGSSGH